MIESQPDNNKNDNNSTNNDVFKKKERYRVDILGFLISIFLISVHILYVVDVTVGLPWPS